MQTTLTQHSEIENDNTFAFRQAVVIGSGIAGLTMARVLADHVANVTIIERDHRPDGEGVQDRTGVPQAHHPHNLQPQGQQILERLFPGMTEELVAARAVRLGEPDDVAFHFEGSWHTAPTNGRHAGVSCSRSLLEQTIYQRIFAHPRIEILHGYEVAGLYAQKDGRRVGGVSLRPRTGAAGGQMMLDGDLVVDASGRRSRAPQWLTELGFQPPEEWHIDALVGYASRLYRRPDDFDQDWQMLYIRPTPPDGTRGGIIVPMEDDQWHVALIGVGGDYPPTNEADFLTFARSLPVPQLYETIKNAEPLSRIHGFRRADNRLRRYDILPRTLEGFLVSGDAVYALNPLYAQGMTLALLACRALNNVLEKHPGRANGDVAGLAQTFQKRLSKMIESHWRLATQTDWQWDATSVDDNTDTLLV
jgi:2-polyprenyl-6-methoxyphenol hydroxylase-like FAD-dependent oxidoreductase